MSEGIKSLSFFLRRLKEYCSTRQWKLKSGGLQWPHTKYLNSDNGIHSLGVEVLLFLETTFHGKALQTNVPSTVLRFVRQTLNSCKIFSTKMFVYMIRSIKLQSKSTAFIERILKSEEVRKTNVTLLYISSTLLWHRATSENWELKVRILLLFLL